MSKRSAAPNPWIIGIGLSVLVPTIVMFALSFGNDPHAVPFLLEGEPAPTFTLADLDGNPVDLASLRGKPVVINFWSTWCVPCKQEHPVLQRGPTNYPDVTFLGVIYQDDADKARHYLRREGTTYRHLLDPVGRTAVQYGVAGVPETYFIDAQGTIVYKQVGPVNDRLLQELLTTKLGGA